jgi:hypothetical protein
MTRSKLEFVRIVRNDAAEVPVRHVDRATREFLKAGRLTRDDAFECVSLAERYWAQAAPSKAPQKKTVRTVRSVRLDMQARADQYLRDLEPHVAQLRRELFNSATPFSSLRKAAAWIELHSTYQPQPINIPAALKLGQAADEAREMNPWSDYEYVMRPLSMVVVRKNGKYGLVAFKRGTPLDHLKRVSKRWAALTGFDAEHLRAYVLAGVKPTLQSMSVEFRMVEPEGGHRDQPRLKRALVSLEMDARDVTLEQFDEIYRYIRKHLGMKRKKALRPFDHMLLEVVSAHGGPPRQFNSKSFWSAVHADRRLSASRAHRSPAALRERYRRMKSKRVMGEVLNG